MVLGAYERYVFGREGKHRSVLRRRRSAPKRLRSVYMSLMRL